MARFRRGLVVSFGLAIGVLTAAGAGFLFWKPSASAVVRMGEALPELRLRPIEGLGDAGVHLAGPTGRVTIVNAFASWCLPCRAEHPLLLEIAARYDVLIVGMNVTDLPENAEAFLAELGNPYDMVGADPSREAFWGLGLLGMPHSIVTDADGIVRVNHPGPITERFVNEVLPALLEQEPGKLESSNNQVDAAGISG